MTDNREIVALVPLKPCPLCQAVATLTFGGEVGRFDQYDVDCTGCGLYFHGPAVAEGDAAKAATITAWNMRFVTPQYPGLPMSDDDLAKHYEASKADAVGLVGSEVRQIIGELRHYRACISANGGQ